MRVADNYLFCSLKLCIHDFAGQSLHRSIILQGTRDKEGSILEDSSERVHERSVVGGSEEAPWQRNKATKERKAGVRLRCGGIHPSDEAWAIMYCTLLHCTLLYSTALNLVVLCKSVVYSLP